MERTAVDSNDAPAPEPMCFSSDDPLTRSLYKAHMVFMYTMLIATMLSLVSLALLIPTIDDVPEYTVTDAAAAFEGLSNATPGRHTVVSPAFDLTVRVESRQLFEAWCHNHGEVVVSYSGVALARGRVLGFCLPRWSAASFTVVTRGEGVYLSDDLRRRLATEWHAGTAKLCSDASSGGDQQWVGDCGWLRSEDRRCYD
ncbi:hypothetical protein C2845_PM07G20750 [Panicum miliaceum]|uniref:Late embryogenesis abundant protein LEA-2 subgroup domain-containing protein n=1 Tax=Panicum miliaceum TaxID=4540 RepID=A0A3L6SJK4_PANMI|nr:hypothetical protein C2845_PM07G20750 [Panicum miliaceum]